jgi:hypothetical protein
VSYKWQRRYAELGEAGLRGGRIVTSMDTSSRTGTSPEAGTAQIRTQCGTMPRSESLPRSLGGDDLVEAEQVVRVVVSLHVDEATE